MSAPGMVETSLALDLALSFGFLISENCET